MALFLLKMNEVYPFRVYIKENRLNSKIKLMFISGNRNGFITSPDLICIGQTSEFFWTIAQLKCGLQLFPLGIFGAICHSYSVMPMRKKLKPRL